ncbi:MAG: hypothetical protein V3W04_04095 [Gammaproteobacteria bacterium]
MVNRHKDQISRRQSVLKRGKTHDEDEQFSNIDDEQGYDLPSRHSGRRRGFGRFIPVFVMAMIAFMIAKSEVPAIDDWWERAISPDKWVARQTCQKTALERSEKRDYMRLIRPGKVNKTNDGYYVERLVYGEMGESGAEESIEYSCYIDTKGNLTSFNRLGQRTALPPQNQHTKQTVREKLIK